VICFTVKENCGIPLIFVLIFWSVRLTKRTKGEGKKGTGRVLSEIVEQRESDRTSLLPFHHLLWQREGRREFVVVFVLCIFSFLCLAVPDKSPGRGGERNYKS